MKDQVDLYIYLMLVILLTLLSEAQLTKTRPEARAKRKAVVAASLRWTNGVIPYELQQGQFSRRQLHDLQTAMRMFEKDTCLVFRPATRADFNKIYFQNGRGCSSQSIGMVGDTQFINLNQEGCRSIGMYLHELGHAIGLLHEHQQPARDMYIRINWAHIEPNMRKWFNVYTNTPVETFDVPYDVSSVMHYGVKSFSKDGADTITVLSPADRGRVGEVYWKLLSSTDVKVINLMYNCSAHCPTDIKCPEEGFIDKDCNCVTHQSFHDSHCFNRYPRERLCGDFADLGLCEYTPDWMSENCRKACDRCPR